MTWQCLELEVAAEFGAIQSAMAYEVMVEMERRVEMLREHRLEIVHERCRLYATQGRCQCGRKARPGRSMCVACAERGRACVKRAIDARRTAGLCTRCGARPAEHGGRMCLGCRVLTREYMRRRYVRKRKPKS